MYEKEKEEKEPICRFLLGEPIIATSLYYSYHYAKDVIKGRFELGEPIILQNVDVTFRYAKYVINGRWEEGEPIIATSAEFSHRYADEVLHDRFGIGENAIFSDQIWRERERYKAYVVESNTQKNIKKILG